MAADRITIAEPAPPQCSSCFQAKPRMVHVDFGAAWDGPVVEGEGVVQHVIDDLIICFDCLVLAGRLVNLGDIEKIQAEFENAERENDDLMEQIRGLKAYIQNLEAVKNGRPDELIDGPKRETKPRKRERQAA